jgi:hypothetical protein
MGEVQFIYDGEGINFCGGNGRNGSTFSLVGFGVLLGRCAPRSPVPPVGLKPPFLSPQPPAAAPKENQSHHLECGDFAKPPSAIYIG